jgi:hypothetical protein
MNALQTIQIARHLNVSETAIKSISEWNNCYLVVFNKGLGLRPRFVSKTAVLKPINWTEAHKLLVTKYQSAKLINVPYKEIKNTYILCGEVVAIETNTIHFVALNDYKQIFVKNRKERLEEISIDSKGNKIFAINTKKQSCYELIPNETTIKCECIDYQNQIKAFGKGCCKHGYALLNTYGFSSLSEYINQREEEIEYQERQNYYNGAYAY